MSKTINALEKEVGLWKARYDKASLTLMETTEEVSSTEEYQVSLGLDCLLLCLFH